LLDLNVDNKYIKIEQKLHCHAYIQAHSADIQLVSGIAVLYPQFGGVATSIQSTCSVQGTGSVGSEEGTPRQIKTVKLYSALQSPHLHRTKWHIDIYTHRHAQHIPYNPSPTWHWLNHKTKEKERVKGIPRRELPKCFRKYVKPKPDHLTNKN